MRQKERDILKRWEILRESVRRSTPVDKTESYADKTARVQQLEKTPEEWFKYYFPKYYFSAPADFQIKATKRLLKNARWFEGRAWSRELAKSTRTMFEALYLACTGKVKNVLMVSHSFDNAVELLMPYHVNLESNQRIINDYGKQQQFGSWEDGHFITSGGVSYRAIGAKQSPRGTKNEYQRPDCIIIDDLETDEISRNEKRIDDVWKWVEQALIPTVSISGNIRVVFLGNIISKNGIMARASKMCDAFDILNIRDENGKSTWPQKNSEQHIDWILSKLSYISVQKEYFNNPIVNGTVFEDINYKKMPCPDDYKMLVAYADPSFKDSKKNDFKALALVGFHEGEYHVLKAFCKQTTTKEMAQWYKALYDHAGSKTPLYMYMEANGTQDLILQQVNEHISKEGWQFVVRADDRKKGDKFSRIESLLEPLNNSSKLFFNLEEKDNEHMKRAEEQMKALEPSLVAHDDFPDALHGGVSILKEKMAALTPPFVKQRVHNMKRM